MEAIEGLLTEKLRLLRELLAETEKQSELIARSDADGLCASLAARQTAMDAVDALDGRIAATGGAGAGPAGLVAEIAAVLRHIVEIDGENRRMAVEMAGAVAHGFREVRAIRSMRAYLPADKNESKFVDREG